MIAETDAAMRLAKMVASFNGLRKTRCLLIELSSGASTPYLCNSLKYDFADLLLFSVAVSEGADLLVDQYFDETPFSEALMLDSISVPSRKRGAFAWTLARSSFALCIDSARRWIRQAACKVTRVLPREIALQVPLQDFEPVPWSLLGQLVDDEEYKEDLACVGEAIAEVGEMPNYGVEAFAELVAFRERASKIRKSPIVKRRVVHDYVCYEMRSDICRCGGAKHVGSTFCFDCYMILPRGVQAGLYSRSRKGYSWARIESERVFRKLLVGGEESGV